MKNNHSNQTSLSVYLRDTFSYYISHARALFNWLQPSFFISHPLLISRPQDEAPRKIPSTTSLIYELLGWKNTMTDFVPEATKEKTHPTENKRKKITTQQLAPLSQSLKNAFINAASGNIQITPPITFAVKKAIDALPEGCIIDNSLLISALVKLIHAKLINTNELPTSTQIFSATATNAGSTAKTRSELLVEMTVLSIDCSELIDILLKINQRSPLVIEKVLEIKALLDNKLLSISEFDHILDTLYSSCKNEKQASSAITSLCKVTNTAELNAFLHDLDIDQDIKDALTEYLDENHSHAFSMLHK